MFKYTNPHPNLLNTTDCVVRAISIAEDRDYLEVRRELNKLKREWGMESYKLNKFMHKYFNRHKAYEKISFPAVKGEGRMRFETFKSLYPKGTYVLNQKRHLVAVKDGVLLDTWNSSHRMIYNAWRID